jgi:hypothetical protein
MVNIRFCVKISYYYVVFLFEYVKTFTFIDSLRKKNTIFALLFIQITINNSYHLTYEL